MNDVAGTIYLLHFDGPYRHAGHYLGWTAGEVDVRVADHLAGRGSPLVAAAVAAKCDVKLVATWPTRTRRDERAEKKNGTLRRICPVCKPGYNARAAERMRRARAKKAAATTSA